MAFLDKNGLIYIKTKLDILFNNKVDKVDGKGLSTNDYTTEEKTKLAGIASGAEVNVNADWNAQSGDAQILHKPTIPTKTSDLTNDSGFITTDDIPEGAAASTTVPKMDGVATVGTETAFARGDHVHPSDTSKVNVEAGKGLSTNDYSNADKQKLTGIANGAQVNVLESISVNGAPQTISGKGVNITVPTTVASLTDAGEYAKKTDLTNVYQYKGSVGTYNELPQDLGAINGTSPVYNVEDTGKNYAWNGTAWDDLGGMFEITAISNGEIDTIFS